MVWKVGNTNVFHLNEIQIVAIGYNEIETITKFHFSRFSHLIIIYQIQITSVYQLAQLIG